MKDRDGMIALLRELHDSGIPETEALSIVHRETGYTERYIFELSKKLFATTIKICLHCGEKFHTTGKHRYCENHRSSEARFIKRQNCVIRYSKSIFNRQDIINDYKKSQDDKIEHHVVIVQLTQKYLYDEHYLSTFLNKHFSYRWVKCKDCGKMFQAKPDERWLYCEDHRGLKKSYMRSTRK